MQFTPFRDTLYMNIHDKVRSNCFQSCEEDLEVAAAVAASMQRSATGATEDMDKWDLLSQKMEEVRMRRRDDIDTMFETPTIKLGDDDIDWVSLLNSNVTSPASRNAKTTKLSWYDC